MISLIPRGSTRWEVEEDYKVVVLNNTIEIPKGFITDLASIPRIMWVVFPPFGRYTEAAVVHDYLYINSELSRAKCDEIFFVLMLRNNVSYYKAKLLYRVVRLFGWISY